MLWNAFGELGIGQILCQLRDKPLTFGSNWDNSIDAAGLSGAAQALAFWTFTFRIKQLAEILTAGSLQRLQRINGTE